MSSIGDGGVPRADARGSASPIAMPQVPQVPQMPQVMQVPQKLHVPQMPQALDARLCVGQACPQVGTARFARGGDSHAVAFLRSCPEPQALVAATLSRPVAAPDA